ncbi:MAG: preprotein translocase subunit SecG [Clostridiales bacterium]|nr:preprotein translocase subunit SecG [Clostridiales bacterium]
MALTTVLTIVILLIALGIIAAVLLQSGRSAGLSGAIAGASEQVFGKRRGLDQFLSRLTVYLAIAFVVLTVLLLFLER